MFEQMTHNYTANYAINVCLTNGDVFARHYATYVDAREAFDRMARNPLCVCCELVGRRDETLAEYPSS